MDCAKEVRLSVTDSLESLVRAVWRRDRTLHLSAGWLAFCHWGIPLFLVGMFADWLLYLPAPVRVLMFLAMLAVALYKAWQGGWRHVREYNATHTALQIEKEHGELESLLVTAIQFQHAELPVGASDAMREATTRRAGEVAAELEPARFVSFAGLRRPLVVAGGIALVLLVFALVNGPFLGAGLARMLPPWSSVSYPTRTQIALAEGDMVVKEGEFRLLRNHA